ncbi:MAG: hypothetical protein ABL921_19605 [Pirellula sp.]
MPKSKKLTSKPTKWYMQLDQDEVNAALEEATVDAYDLEEQHTGLFHAVAEEMKFPWQGSALGETLTVVDAAMPDDNGLGLDIVVERQGKQYRVDAGSVELLKPFPEGHLYLAAYLSWRKTL